VRLVYQPLAAPGVAASDLLDARTGGFLDWEGKPLSQQPRAYRFKDLAGNFAEKEISLLGQAGISRNKISPGVETFLLGTGGKG